MPEPNLDAAKTPRMPSMVTIYDPEGNPHVCAPIDAREILASGVGYTKEPVAIVASQAAELPTETAQPEVVDEKKPSKKK